MGAEYTFILLPTCSVKYAYIEIASSVSLCDFMGPFLHLSIGVPGLLRDWGNALQEINHACVHRIENDSCGNREGAQAYRNDTVVEMHWGYTKVPYKRVHHQVWWHLKTVRNIRQWAQHFHFVLLGVARNQDILRIG